jgi:hypothetical protein
MYPPLRRFGLSHLATDDTEKFKGLPYLDTFFVVPRMRDAEWLYVQEIVHTMQWEVLGPDRFLLEYADGIYKFPHREDYDLRPLERMAKNHDQQFERGALYDIEPAVRAELAEWPRWGAHPRGFD